MVQAAGGRRADTRGWRSRRVGRLLLAVMVLAMVFSALAVWPAIPAQANHDPYCYVVGDNSSNQRVLARVTKADFNSSTNEVTLGVLGTLKTDGITLHPTSGVLYGVNTNMSTHKGIFGSINLNTGAFTAIGTGLGTANGSLGLQDLYDVSGLAFDPATGFLYGTHVRTGSDTAVDLLFRVNIVTGAFVPNAFGVGKDYVTLPKLDAFAQFNDVDDIAIEPATSQMYGIMNNSTSGDRLITIDKLTGATTDVGGFGVAEVEGLAFDPHGQLWATAGGTSGTEANKLYLVNKTTGAATSPRLLDNAADYEALTCMTAAVVVSTATPSRTPTATRTPTVTRTSTGTPSQTPTATATRTSPPPTMNPSLTKRVYVPLVLR